MASLSKFMIILLLKCSIWTLVVISTTQEQCQQIVIVKQNIYQTIITLFSTTVIPLHRYLCKVGTLFQDAKRSF
jgi:hypothetical protein